MCNVSYQKSASDYLFVSKIKSGAEECNKRTLFLHIFHIEFLLVAWTYCDESISVIV